MVLIHLGAELSEEAGSDARGGAAPVALEPSMDVKVVERASHHSDIVNQTAEVEFGHLLRADSVGEAQVEAQVERLVESPVGRPVEGLREAGDSW